MKTVILIPDKVSQNWYGIYMGIINQIDALSRLYDDSLSPGGGFRQWGDMEPS